jgi:hypothetical protein
MTYFYELELIMEEYVNKNIILNISFKEMFEMREIDNDSLTIDTL